MNPQPIALGARLKGMPGIRTIGFKPRFNDYSDLEKKWIRNAETVYYPTAFYADLFNAMGKKTFPSFHTYKFAMDKIKQTAMFQMLGLPHPRTRVYYGKTQKQTILDDFDFPFVAKKPRGSARGKGVFLIKSAGDLKNYLKNPGPAYIQEYLPLDRDMRIIIIGRKVRLAFWRVAQPGRFLTNLSQGGELRLDPLPESALALALETALKCGWDDVGIDIALHKDQAYVLEGNMKYGTLGFAMAGIPYRTMLAGLVLSGEI